MYMYMYIYKYILCIYVYIYIYTCYVAKLENTPGVLQRMPNREYGK